MPPAKKRNPECPPDYMDMWMCEACSAMYEGVNPPDVCGTCEHTYFENVCDVLSAPELD